MSPIGHKLFIVTSFVVVVSVTRPAFSVPDNQRRRVSSATASSSSTAPIITRWQQRSRTSDEVFYTIDGQVTETTMTTTPVDMATASTWLPRQRPIVDAALGSEDRTINVEGPVSAQSIHPLSQTSTHSQSHTVTPVSLHPDDVTPSRHRSDVANYQLPMTSSNRQNTMSAEVIGSTSTADNSSSADEDILRAPDRQETGVREQRPSASVADIAIDRPEVEFHQAATWTSNLTVATSAAGESVQTGTGNRTANQTAVSTVTSLTVNSVAENEKDFDGRSRHPTMTDNSGHPSYDSAATATASHGSESQHFGGSETTYVERRTTMSDVGQLMKTSEQHPGDDDARMTTNSDKLASSSTMTTSSDDLDVTSLPPQSPKDWNSDDRRGDVVQSSKLVGAEDDDERETLSSLSSETGSNYFTRSSQPPMPPQSFLTHNTPSPQRFHHQKQKQQQRYAHPDSSRHPHVVTQSSVVSDVRRGATWRPAAPYDYRPPWGVVGSPPGRRYGPPETRPAAARLLQLRRRHGGATAPASSTHWTVGEPGGDDGYHLRRQQQRKEWGDIGPGMTVGVGVLTAADSMDHRSSSSSETSGRSAYEEFVVRLPSDGNVVHVGMQIVNASSATEFDGEMNSRASNESSDRNATSVSVPPSFADADYDVDQTTSTWSSDITTTNASAYKNETLQDIYSNDSSTKILNSTAQNETTINVVEIGGIEAVRGVVPDNEEQQPQFDHGDRSVLPAIVGVLQALTRKQFSWVDLLLAVSCTVAILLACINLAMFIVHVTRGKRGKLTFPRTTPSSLPPPVPPPPPPPSNTAIKHHHNTNSNKAAKDVRSNTSGSSSGYADHLSMSPRGTATPPSSNSSPPLPHHVAIPLPPTGARSTFSPTDRKRMFGRSGGGNGNDVRSVAADLDETLRIRSLTFKRPLTDWGFTNASPTLPAAMASFPGGDGGPDVVGKVSLKSNGSDRSSSSGVESAEAGHTGSEFGTSDVGCRFEPLPVGIQHQRLHNQHYQQQQTAKMVAAATLRSANQQRRMTASAEGPEQQASSYQRQGVGGGTTLFNNYVYSGVGGLVIDVDDKDSDYTTNSDFVYGKNYVELNTNKPTLTSQTGNDGSDIANRKRRERRGSRVGQTKRRGECASSGSRGPVNAIYRPWKKLFGASKAACKNKADMDEQFVKQIL